MPTAWESKKEMLVQIFCALLLSCPLLAQTQLVLLGTGNPRQTPGRWGPASAVVYKDNSYLFDAGPGVVRRAAAAASQKNIPSLEAPKLRRVFLTHLHSDHTLGLPDLIFSPWVVGRHEPLEIYGPKGTRAMVKHIQAAWSQDIHIRVKGLEQANTTGYKTIVHEIDAGYSYRDGAVTITAIPVHHGSWPQAFGYRVQTPDKVIVISGDCAPSPALIDACNGCDILLHEVYSRTGMEQRGPEWVRYLSQFHTSTDELAEIAKKAHPRLLILYHQGFSPLTQTPEALLGEMHRSYEGLVVSGSDLDVY